MKSKSTHPSYTHENVLMGKIYVACLILQIILIALTAAFPGKELFTAGFLLFTFCISAFHFARWAPRLTLHPLPRLFFPRTRHEALSLGTYLLTALLHGVLYTALLYPEAFSA